MNGEHFIPFRKADVVSMCAGELPESERESFLGFTRMLASLLHHRFHDPHRGAQGGLQPVQPGGRHPGGRAS